MEGPTLSTDGNASPAAATAPQPSCFKSKQQMIDAAGLEWLVCLHFAASTPITSLYAHKSFLRCCSRVMKTLLDEEAALLTTPQQQQQPSKVSKLRAGSSPASAAACSTPAAAADAGLPVSPMTDEDPTAWEEALALMYPLPPGLQISWDNAKRLLLLADKYDVPLITERIRAFFTSKKRPYIAITELGSGLAAGTAFDWLLLFSKTGLDDLATPCIDYITSNAAAALPPGFCSSGLQQKHVEQLCDGLQRQNATLQRQLGAARSTLAAVKNAGPQAYYARKCSKCATQWYTQPAGLDPATNCIKCGTPKRLGLAAK